MGVKSGECEVDTLPDEMPEPQGKNLLVSNSRKMLAFRFPASKYIVYSAKDTKGDRAFLVFNTPRCGGHVQLRHWSAQNVLFENVAAVLEDVIRRCHRVAAASLSVTIPTSEADHLGDIRRLGFRHTRTTASLQLFSGTKQISTDPARWRLTEIHKGFLSFE
jgi:hypothetical protein